MSLQLKMLIFLLAVTSIGVVLKSSYTGWIPLKVPQSCSCEKCFSKEDVYLNDHLNRSIKPFLSASTNLSREDFIWWSVSCFTFLLVTCRLDRTGLTAACLCSIWQHLQSNRQNFSYFKGTLNKLFKIIPPSPVHEKPSTEGCRTCSVVGNSVNLKGSHYGPLIDFQDVVIRYKYSVNMNHIYFTVSESVETTIQNPIIFSSV